MRKDLLYLASMVVCGGVIGEMGLSMVLSSGVVNLGPFMAVGGLGMAGAAIYRAGSSKNTDEYVPDDRIVWFTTAMAAVATVSGLWSLLA
jgi:glutamate synthase domain-containing protein 3